MRIEIIDKIVSGCKRGLNKNSMNVLLINWENGEEQPNLTVSVKNYRQIKLKRSIKIQSKSSKSYIKHQKPKQTNLSLIITNH